MLQFRNLPFSHIFVVFPCVALVNHTHEKCIVVRTNHFLIPANNHGPPSKSKLIIIVVATVAGVLFLLAAVSCCCLWMKKNRRKSESDMASSLPPSTTDHGLPYRPRSHPSSSVPDEHLGDLYENTGSYTGKDVDLPLFDLEVILDATDNFAEHNKIGAGGFGPVYVVRKKRTSNNLLNSLFFS
jgi:hypothetical protein